jgi:hypothetical protein
MGRASVYSSLKLKSSSGAKPIIHYGASPLIRKMPALRLVARLVERLRFYRFKALWSAGAQTLEAVFGYHLT